MVKTAGVTTNDPARPHVTLVLRAFFTPGAGTGPAAGTVAPSAKPAAPPAERRAGPFTMRPGGHWAAEIFPGETARGKISLINREAAPVRVLEITTAGNAFNFQLRTVKDGKRYDILVYTAAGLKSGRHTQNALLTTDHHEAPEIWLSFEVTVRPRVYATPAEFNLPNLSLDGAGPELSLGTIHVRKAAKSGLKIGNVESTLPFIRAEVKPQTRGRVYAIRILADKSTAVAGSAFSGAIRVSTNDDEVKVISIPVRGSFLR